MTKLLKELLWIFTLSWAMGYVFGNLKHSQKILHHPWLFKILFLTKKQTVYFLGFIWQIINYLFFFITFISIFSNSLDSELLIYIYSLVSYICFFAFTLISIADLMVQNYKR